jgi:hypothetical protein
LRFGRLVSKTSAREARLTRLAFIFLLFAAPPASGAEAWNCQFPGHGGVWQIDGSDLVAPPSSGSTRFPVVRNTPDALVALTEEFSGRRFEMVVLDRRKLLIRILLVNLEANGEQREAGSCTMPDARAAAEARSAVGDVRRRIRDLVQQAESLANRGYTSAADLKLTEAQGFERLTADESQLIGQMRQYVAAKPRR